MGMRLVPMGFQLIKLLQCLRHPKQGRTESVHLWVQRGATFCGAAAKH